MLEKLKRVNALTCVVLMGAIVALVIMVRNGWTPTEVAAAAGSLMAILSQLDRLLRPGAGDAGPPPVAFLFPPAIGLGLAALLGACASRGTAEAEYTHEQLRCVEQERVPETEDERRASWARVEACWARVRARWGIVETRKDGGQ